MRNPRHPRHARRLAIASAALIPLLAGALVAGAAHALEPDEVPTDPVAGVAEAAPTSDQAAAPPTEDAAPALEDPAAAPAEDAAAPVDGIVPDTAPRDAAPRDAAPQAGVSPADEAPLAGTLDAVSRVVEPGQSIIVNQTITGASEIVVSVAGPAGEKRIELVPPGGVASATTGSGATVTHRLNIGSPLPDGSYRILIHNRSDQRMELVYEIAWRSADVAVTPQPSRPRTGLTVEADVLFGGAPLPDGSTATVQATGLDGTAFSGTLARDASSPERWRAFLGNVTGDFLVRAEFTVGGTTHSALWATTIDGLDDVLPGLEYLTDPAASNSRGWFARPVTVTLRASDSGSGIDRIEWQLDDGPLQSTPGGFVQIPVADGRHRLDYRAIDAAGNATGWRVREPAVDTVAPAVTADGPRHGVEYALGEVVAVDYACTDALSGILDCLAPLAVGATLPTDVEGDHTFEIVATDRAGNIQRTTVAYRVVDPGLPVVDLALPSAEGLDGWYLDAPVLDLVGSATAVEIHWTDTVDGVERSGMVSGSNATFIPDREGAHELRYWAVDALGRTGEPATAAFRIDATDPLIEVRSPVSRASRALAPGQVLLGAVLEADFACSDAVSGLVDCVGSTPDGGRLPTGSLGMQSFTVTATDAAGRSVERVVAYEVVAAPAGPRSPGLAVTGAEAGALGLAGLLLLVLGGAAVLVARRRPARG